MIYEEKRRWPKMLNGDLANRCVQGPHDTSEQDASRWIGTVGWQIESP